MKKLIINQKNLPRVKQSDSSIRIRINKTTLPHQNVPLKKSPSSQLSDIDRCLQVFERGNGKSVLVDEEMVSSVIALLKCLKDSLTSNQQLMTQSLRFSKLKFKTIAEVQQKENIPTLLSNDKNTSNSQSDRYQEIPQKTVSQSKTPKNKKLFSNLYTNSKQDPNYQQKQNDQHNQNQLFNQNLYRQDYQHLSQSHYLKLQENQTLSISESFCSNLIHQKSSHKIQTLQQHVQQLTKQANKRNQDIKQLNERIEQLNLNIKNLIKKNSEKAEQCNKLYQECNEIKQTLSKIPTLEEQIQCLKVRCMKLERQKKELQIKKQEVECNWREIEREKNNKIEQQLGRYETAQKFYELTRRDLREENDKLISLLEERQREATYLYQVVQKKQQQQKNHKKIAVL